MEGPSYGYNLPSLSQALRKYLVASDELFSGRPDSYLLAANGGTRVKMYAPYNAWTSSSVSHWDNSVTFTTFMKHSIDKGFRCIVINAIEVAIMRDMGWEIPPCNPIINNKIYDNGIGTVNGFLHIITGCTIEISNTIIQPYGTVKIHGRESVILKPGFYAMKGSDVRITAGGSNSLRSSTDEENEYSHFSLEELAVKSPEIVGINFSVYPNPNDGNFTVKVTGEVQPYTLEIFNNLGGMLGFVNCNDKIVNINRTDLNTGIYFVKITMNGKIAVKKIIIQ